MTIKGPNGLFTKPSNLDNPKPESLSQTSLEVNYDFLFLYLFQKLVNNISTHNSKVLGPSAFIFYFINGKKYD